MYKPGGIKAGQVDPFEGFTTEPWIKFFVNQTDQIDAAAAVVETESLTDQSASIGTTAFDIGSVTAGLFRVTHYAHITTAATTGAQTSSLTVHLAWTDTQTMAHSYSAITGNLNTTFQSGTQMVYIDNATSLSYSTTYASDTASEMVYDLRFTIERVS